MSVEGILIMVAAVSAITALAVEAEKKWCIKKDKEYAPNLMAGYTAVIISVLVFSAYIVIWDISFTIKILVSMVAVALLSWLCSQVGYDKTKQLVSQVVALHLFDKFYFNK